MPTHYSRGPEHYEWIAKMDRLQTHACLNGGTYSRRFTEPRSNCISTKYYVITNLNAWVKAAGLIDEVLFYVSHDPMGRDHIRFSSFPR